MKLTVLGCGDAFGSGGRLQTAYHVTTEKSCFLIDCGATALIGLERTGLDPNDVETIFVSHLHGDHFAGLVWWMLHAHHVSKRTQPLCIAGPPGIEPRYRQASEALFPGAVDQPLAFPLTFVELQAGRRDAFEHIAVTPFEVDHPSGAPSYALRLENAGKTLAFSGDTAWVEALVKCGREADLFICECYGFDSAVKYHMNWHTLAAQLPRIGAARVMLTHMSNEMLAHSERAALEGIIVCQDGLILEV